MANKDMRNTLRGATGLAATDAEMERGWKDDVPTDSYEGSLDRPMPHYDMVSGEFTERHAGIEWAGELEPGSDYRRRHGMDDEYGFVRRPMHRTDIERY